MTPKATSQWIGVTPYGDPVVLFGAQVSFAVGVVDSAVPVGVNVIVTSSGPTPSSPVPVGVDAVASPTVNTRQAAIASRIYGFVGISMSFFNPVLMLLAEVPLVDTGIEMDPPGTDRDLPSGNALDAPAPHNLPYGPVHRSAHSRKEAYPCSRMNSSEARYLLYLYPFFR